MKYNTERLQNESTKFLYQHRLNSKLNRNEFTDTQEMYKYLKIVFMKQQRNTWVKKRITREGKQLLGKQK